MAVGYGKSIRKAVEGARKKAGSRYKCPACSRVAMRRVASGVWQCRKCEAKYASGAYEFRE